MHFTFHLTDKNFGDCFTIKEKFNIIGLNWIRVCPKAESTLDFFILKTNLVQAKTNDEINGLGVPVIAGEIQVYELEKEQEQSKNKGFTTEFIFLNAQGDKIDPKEHFKSVTIDVDFEYDNGD